MTRGIVVAALLLAACGDRKDEAMSADTSMVAAAPATAEYTVIVKGRWTKANFSLEYPEGAAHFSGLIGATHGDGYDIFSEGAMPTTGLERLSEEGKHTPLDAEIRAAISAGSAGALFESGALHDFADSLVTTFQVDSDHPLVSVVAMVAPSPDWFTGVRDVNLRENGQWVTSRTIDLYAYDSGGDDGTTYRAADRDTNPKKPTMKSTDPHFVSNGAAQPVGSITFLRR